LGHLPKPTFLIICDELTYLDGMEVINQQCCKKQAEKFLRFDIRAILEFAEVNVDTHIYPAKSSMRV